MQENIMGTVKKIIYQNGEGFFICTVQPEVNRKIIKILVNHPNIIVGFTGEFVGKWEEDPKGDGMQLKCAYVMEQLPDTKEGFQEYLAANFKGIGAAKAKQISEHLGDNPMNMLETNPERILSTPKVKESILQKILLNWTDNRGKMKIQVFLQQHGIVGKSLEKIYSKYGNDTITLIKENPYIIIYDIDRIGFKMADKLAMRLGIAPNSELRIHEAIKYVLINNTNYGGCYLLEEQLLKNVTTLLEITDTEKIMTIVEGNEDIVRVDLNGTIRYYSELYYDLEQNVLDHVGKMLTTKLKIETPTLPTGTTLTTEQLDGVVGALTNKLSILTGGPGCGKTYTTKTIVDYLVSIDKDIGICAPTGKAAIRSTEVIGYPATTIHRLLSFNPHSGFQYNKFHKLDLDYIIIEESSMIDISLLSSLFDAIPKRCQVLMVGDHNQLPPVGVGAPFKDILESNVVPTYTLKQIFRQAANSDIIKTAHSINSGDTKINLPSPLIEPHIWGDERDCFFIDTGYTNINKERHQHPKTSTLHYGFNIYDMIVRLYTKTITEKRGLEDIQILIPKRVGRCGTIKINEMIQDVVNPITESFEITFSDKRFRMNDKVIHIRNNYNLGETGVFNGEIGRIVKMDVKKSTCTVQFVDKAIDYKRSDLADLELAFAITIHKSQGSEFDAIIVPMLPEFNIMLERSLIYTGITRAKKLAIVLGDKWSFLGAVRNVNTTKRQTSLAEFLIENHK